ncbi:MAG: GUN4 domain-containing protein [Hormoscilla sp. GM7CHS1pb]|nr:GUN4 domain-containing protein [Hormoscilla sp. GM7CHS1pb]
MNNEEAIMSKQNVMHLSSEVESNATQIGMKELLQEIQATPKEHWSNLLQMVRLFRESVTMKSGETGEPEAGAIGETSAQNAKQHQALPIVEHEEKSSSTSEITASRSEPSLPPTIPPLHVDRSEVTAQPEEQVPPRYHKLRDLLAAGEWKGADIETAQVMLQVAGRTEKGWLSRGDIKNFPCEDLHAIDKLWVKYSDGRFGFSVQKRIWLEEGGKVDYKTECRLSDRVGWRVRNSWQGVSNLTFSLAAPTGHLPWVMGLYGVEINPPWKLERWGWGKLVRNRNELDEIDEDMFGGRWICEFCSREQTCKL